MEFRRALALSVALGVLAAGPACKDDVDPEAQAAALAAKLEEADARLKNDKVQDAERLYLSILKEHPEHPGAEYGLAKVRYFEKSYGDAEALFAKVAQHQAENPDYHYYRGHNYELQGKLAEAAESYKTAFGLDDNRSEFGQSYGRMLKKQEQWAEAEQVFRRVAEIDPMAVFVNTDVADCLREQGKLDEALKTYMKALTANASDKMAHAGAALVYEAQGNPARAMDEWSTYIRMDCCSEYSANVAKKKVEELQAAAAKQAAGGDTPAPAEPDGGDDGAEDQAG